MGVLNEKRCITQGIKLKSFITVNERQPNPMTTIGVPTQSSVTTYQQNKTTLELLLNLQQLVDDFKVKLVEMEEEMDAIKIENNVLRNKIRELTSPSSTAKSTPPQRRGGCFGYGADEF
jgi:hypothetical protein